LAAFVLCLHAPRAFAAASRAPSAQASLPDLPRLALETFPPPTRDAIQKPYSEATARPTDADAVGALGRALQAWEQWSAAHDAYARAHALAPRAFDWIYLDGVVLQRLARQADAAARFDAALGLRSDYLPARVKLAEARLESGDADSLDAAAKAFESLLREPAAMPAAEFGLGRIEAARGRHDAAIDHLQRAVALFPEWGAAHYALALSYRAVGRRDEAQRALARHQQYGARWPAVDDPVLAAVTAGRDDAQTRLTHGLKLAEAGDAAGAIAEHEAALALDPTIAQAHANLIGLYGGLRNWTKAEEHYRAVVALGVNLGDAHYDYGVLLGLQEKWAEAAAAYRLALAVNPRHAGAANNLGSMLERQSDRDGAAAAYRQAIDSQPTFRLARFNLGRMLIAQGRADDAVRTLEPIVEPRDAEAPRYLFALATAHIRAGHKDDGIKWAVDAAKLAREHGQVDLAAAIERDLAQLR
jgi:tetratricopeptide (TPR) repeat protein